jgi:hypothetical protein
VQFLQADMALQPPARGFAPAAQKTHDELALARLSSLYRICCSVVPALLAAGLAAAAATLLRSVIFDSSWLQFFYAQQPAAARDALSLRHAVNPGHVATLAPLLQKLFVFLAVEADGTGADNAGAGAAAPRSTAVADCVVDHVATLFLPPSGSVLLTAARAPPALAAPNSVLNACCWLTAPLKQSLGLFKTAEAAEKSLLTRSLLAFLGLVDSAPLSLLSRAADGKLGTPTALLRCVAESFLHRQFAEPLLQPLLKVLLKRCYAQCAATLTATVSAGSAAAAAPSRVSNLFGLTDDRLLALWGPSRFVDFAKALLELFENEGAGDDNLSGILLLLMSMHATEALRDAVLSCTALPVLLHAPPPLPVAPVIYLLPTETQPERLRRLAQLLLEPRAVDMLSKEAIRNAIERPDTALRVPHIALHHVAVHVLGWSHVKGDARRTPDDAERLCASSALLQSVLSADAADVATIQIVRHAVASWRCPAAVLAGSGGASRSGLHAS